MVVRIVSALLLMSAVSAWGGTYPQLCLSCHPAHYIERGRCSDCHHGNPASERKNIAHVALRGGKYVRFTLGDAREIRAGERLMEQLACRRCHVSGGRGTGLAVSLDESATRKTAEELALSITRPAVSMPQFALTENQTTALVNSVFAGSIGRETVKSIPVRVHFSSGGKKSEDIFSKKCGSCHRIISQLRGVVGESAVGPNLSGLFSEYYPKSFRDGEVWNSRNLSDWLKNPRDIRAWARMQPVPLTVTEIKELEAILLISPEQPRNQTGLP